MPLSFPEEGAEKGPPHQHRQGDLHRTAALHKGRLGERKHEKCVHGPQHGAFESLEAGEEGAGRVVLADERDAQHGPHAVLHLLVTDFRDEDEERGEGEGEGDLHGLNVAQQQGAENGL